MLWVRGWYPSQLHPGTPHVGPASPFMNRAKNAVLHVALHAPSNAAGLLPSTLGPGARAKSSRLERLSFRGWGIIQCELRLPGLSKVNIFIYKYSFEFESLLHTEYYSRV